MKTTLNKNETVSKTLTKFKTNLESAVKEKTACHIWQTKDFTVKVEKYDNNYKVSKVYSNGDKPKLNYYTKEKFEENPSWYI